MYNSSALRGEKKYLFKNEDNIFNKIKTDLQIFLLQNEVDCSMN